MLIDGKIEAGKSCHHKEQCRFALEGSCYRETFIENKYSCGAARWFEIDYLKNLESKNES